MSKLIYRKSIDFIIFIKQRTKQKQKKQKQKKQKQKQKKQYKKHRQTKN